MFVINLHIKLSLASSVYNSLNFTCIVFITDFEDERLYLLTNLHKLCALKNKNKNFFNSDFAWFRYEIMYMYQ